jgi:soluble lytic murein transglycosylase-like protein
MDARGARDARGWAGQAGSVSVLVVGGLVGLVVGALVIGLVARVVGREGAAQRAADLGALAGARAMHAAYARLFEPAWFGDAANPRHLEVGAYLALGRAAAVKTAARNGMGEVRVSFPDGRSFAPVRIRVAVREAVQVRRGDARREVEVDAVATAELAPPGDPLAGFASGGGYDGPLAYRQGKPMRPDVALAFDRMARAARADGIDLLVNSGFRSDAEQAALFAQHPDPRWVAPPGRSLHRNATELDLGPASAYAWLAAHADAFHFVQRYSWEPWHYGYVLNARSAPAAGAASAGAGAGTGASGSDGQRGRGGTSTGGAVPAFVPARFAPVLARAAQRWNVSATLLAAQLYAESGFNPFAVSPAGAQGIAQFMPGTARGLGLANPFDAEAAIDAQAHLMRDLLRQFGSVPLALAAYNAGPGAVSGCGCVPPYAETRAYVARILGLMSGAGEAVGAGAGGGLVVRLVA